MRQFTPAVYGPSQSCTARAFTLLGKVNMFPRDRRQSMETVLPPCSCRQHTPSTTTLYALIEALQNAFGPENDDLVVATVMYLLRSQCIRFLPNLEASRCN